MPVPVLLDRVDRDHARGEQHDLHRVLVLAQERVPARLRLRLGEAVRPVALEALGGLGARSGRWRGSTASSCERLGVRQRVPGRCLGRGGATAAVTTHRECVAVAVIVRHTVPGRGGGSRDHPARVMTAPGARVTIHTCTSRLAILLAMAMFVLVVDTSLMNVSISAVVEDLDTTVSGVQSAIALEALVSAAFILIGSKVGDLIGRKRAYVLGLLGYAIGALAMTLAQSLTAIIIFWAIIGGLGASLLLPAMQSLIHGNFEGAAQKKVYALVGAAAAIAAAVGPLLGGFITTYLSWRVGVPARGRHHRGRAVGHQARPRRAVHRAARDRRRRRGALGRSAWAASCSASSSGRRAARRSARCSRSARSRSGSLAWWLRAAQARGQADADRPGPVPRRSSSGSGSPGRCCSRSRSAAR